MSEPPPNPNAGHGATDRSLLQQYQRGTDDAATELFVRYAARLRALATAHTGTDVQQRVDPDDIVQSVFRTFFRRAAAGQYEVPDGDDLWKLLVVIGLNKIRATAAHHRADKRDVRATVGGAAFDAAARAVPDDPEGDLQVLRLTIDEVLAPLPPGHREIVTARIAGHEVAEIARRTGRAKRSVERILQEFRAALDGVLHDGR
jgi:RNA polymerase sigma-70 factor (ECF subfamily)